MTQPNLLSDKDVQKVLQIAEGLINGTKKLVIISDAMLTTDVVEVLGERQVIPVTSYVHTLRIEDVETETNNGR